MDREWMRCQLPDAPPKGLINWVRSAFPEELGPEFAVFRAERYPVQPGLTDIMERSSMKPVRYEWGAEVTCTCCRETFVTQKVTGVDAIRLAVGEDGLVYTLDPGEPTACYDHIEDAFDGERFACPLCFSEVQLIHSKKLRGGRRKRIMVQALQNVQGYTCIFYWMIVRYIDESGMDYVDTEPMDAYVLTESGSLVHYTHVRRTSFGTYSHRVDWCCTDRCKDYHDTPYGDWGSINNKKAGTVTYPEHIEMEGVTGEKTGLLEFMNAGGFALVDYLKFWRRHRSIENLMKCGQAALVTDIFRVAERYC